MHNYLENFFKKYLLIFTCTSLVHSFDQLVGVLVEFQPDSVNSLSGQIIDDPETSGDGQFLTSDDLNLSFIQYQNISKCSSFLVDKPPHNTDYFLLQMLAVKNYYNSISNGEIDFNIGVIDQVFQLDNNMKYYSISDDRIGLLFSESIDKLNSADANGSLLLQTLNDDVVFDSNQNILYVVFHAGLGQESSTDFDPTIYDIRSAFVDDQMLDLDWINTNNISSGLVMPETLNMIYYDVIEDAIPTNIYMEDIYCNQQFGMVGLFAHLLGYSFGFPPLHNVENGNPRVGVFDLMDVGFFNGRGVIPAPPSAWIRTNEHFSFITELENITENINNVVETYQLPCRSYSDKVYKIDISNDEYFLIENRIKYLNVEEETVDDLQENYIALIYDENFNDLPGWVPEWYYDGSIEDITLVPGWFDIMNEELSNHFEIDGGGAVATINYSNEYNVITSVSNYDSGLPGSGMLIWHINEPTYSNGYEYGINDDLFNKAIALEEGDGSADIGDLNLVYGLWSNEKFISGNGWDLWRKGNAGYKQNNHINNYNNDESIYFNSSSFPDSRTHSGVLSNISLRASSTYGEIMEFEVRAETPVYDAQIIYLEEGSKVIGNNGFGCVFYLNTQNEIFEYCDDGSLNKLYFEDLGDNNIITSTDPNSGHSDYSLFSIDGIQITDPEIIILSSDTMYGNLIQSGYGYYIDPETFQITNSQVNPMGILYPDEEDFDQDGNTLFDKDIIAESEKALSLGNIDENDEYHEIVYINNGNLIVENYNGSYVNGFPVSGDYTGVPLIFNITSESAGTEIVCVNGDKIDILSNKGELIYEIPNFGNSKISATYWNTGDGEIFNSGIYEYCVGCSGIALTNGDRLYVFSDILAIEGFWFNPLSTTSNYPLAHSFSLDENNNPNNNNNNGVDLTRVYNYPNPIEDNSTRFRFYVYNSNSVHIDIYDITGYKVKTLYKNNMTHNEYNEILWESINLPAGLYFASVKSDLKQSKVLKLVIQ